MRNRRALVTAALVAVLAAGCTGGTEPDDGDATPRPSSTTAAALSVEQFAESVLSSPEVTSQEAGLDEPLATFTAPVAASADRVYDVEVTVVALTASDVGADLTFSMRTADGSDGSRSEHYSWGTSTRSDLRSIELRVDAQSALKPYTIMSQPDIEQDALCACSDFPKKVTGASQVRGALFPPLPAGTSQVQLAFPGAEPVTVPVTWDD